MTNAKELSLRSPIRVYVVSFLAALLLVILACFAILGVHAYYRFPNRWPDADFVKNYVQGYAAVITLVIGLPVTFASSVAVVLLAKASVEATMEQPRIEQSNATMMAIKDLHDGWAVVVSALNAVDDAISEVGRKVAVLDWPVPDGSPEAEDWFSISNLARPMEGLSTAVSTAIKKAEQAFCNPMLRANIMFNLKHKTLLVECEYPEAKGKDGLSTLIIFAGMAAAHRHDKTSPSSEMRLRDVYISTEWCDLITSGHSLRAWLDPAQKVAVAGLAFWEVADTRDNEEDFVHDSDGVEVIDRRWRVARPERFPAAAFLCDLVDLVPDAGTLASFIADYNNVFRIECDPAIVEATAKIYNPKLNLRPSLVTACQAFRAKRSEFRQVVGSRQTETVRTGT